VREVGEEQHRPWGPTKGTGPSLHLGCRMTHVISSVDSHRSTYAPSQEASCVQAAQSFTPSAVMLLRSLGLMLPGEKLRPQATSVA
jgi:hypothetical protein